MNLGEFRRETARFPDDTPIRVESFCGEDKEGELRFSEMEYNDEEYENNFFSHITWKTTMRVGKDGQFERTGDRPPFLLLITIGEPG